MVCDIADLVQKQGSEARIRSKDQKQGPEARIRSKDQKRQYDKIILRGTFLGITSKDFLVLKGLKGKVFNGVASKGSGMQLL